jgi:hypothetical protein
MKMKTMKISLLLTKLMVFTAIIVLFTSCASIIREEKDEFTISDIDTTFQNYVKNSPSNEDRGVVFPSSREILVERSVTQRDSSFTRYYPDFIRLGLFESIGIVGGDPKHAIGTGLFGVFPMGNITDAFRGEDDKVFTGGIYRIGISEIRLRWFRDSKNWTLGTHGVEFIIPDARAENILISVLPIYVRKRFFLREEIPYIAFTPSFGIGLVPSQYINLSGSLDIGSIGGLNLRAYLGLAVGVNTTETPQIKQNDYTDKAQTIACPYAGLGISFLDFLNLVPETFVEWKDHEHSAWQIGLIELGLHYTNSERSVFADTIASKVLKGFDIEIAKTNLALPFGNNRFYAGVSLLHFLGMGMNSWGLGILPLRFGYWHTLIEDELTITPFMELGMYPTKYLNVSGELNLQLSESLNLGIRTGYITGSSDEISGGSFVENFGRSTSFSNFYFGLGIRLQNRIFFQHHLRYNRPELPLEPKKY